MSSGNSTSTKNSSGPWRNSVICHRTIIQHFTVHSKSMGTKNVGRVPIWAKSQDSWVGRPAPKRRTLIYMKTTVLLAITAVVLLLGHLYFSQHYVWFTVDEHLKY